MSYQDLIDAAVGCWPLQETTGTIAGDVTGNGHDGTLQNLNFGTNSVAGPTAWLPQALNSDGTSLQRVVIPNHVDLQGGGEFTIAAWFDTSYDSRFIPIGKGSGITEKDYALVRYPTSNVQFANKIGYWSETGGTDHRVLATAPSGNSWLHVVASYDNVSGSTVVYFNGIQVTSASLSGESAVTSSDLTFFTFAYETSGQAGSIAGIAVWDQILSQPEVLSLYQGPVPLLLTAPSITGNPTIAETLAIQAATWDHHGFNVVQETTQIEVSDDGISNWQTISNTDNITSYVVPLVLLNKHLRLASVAENKAGFSTAAYSNSLKINQNPWTGVIEQGEVAISGLIQGEINLESGQTAGLVIPGGRE